MGSNGTAIGLQARMEQRRLQEEEYRRLQNKIYQRNPMKWLEERFGEDPLSFMWSLRGTKYSEYAETWAKHRWDGDTDPLYNAWMDLANGNWVGIEAATGTSKTYFLSRCVFWFLDCFPNSLIVTSAPKQAQLTLHLWSEIATAFNKFKRIRPKAAIYSLRLVVEEEDTQNKEDWDNALTSKSWQAVGFVAGVGSIEQSATKAQGFHRENMLIITEETPGMPEPVMVAFKNTCTGENNLILAVGNPDNQLDPLHTFATSANTKHYRISAYDYPNVVEDREIIKGAVTRASIRRRIADYGKTSDLYRSRVRGIAPAQSTDSLIKLDWCQQAAKRIPTYDDGYNAVGVDVANSIDGDKACLAWGKGRVLKELHEFQCPNATHLAYNLIMDDKTLSTNGYTDYDTKKLGDFEIMDGLIGIDAVGVGVATINALVDCGYNPVGLSGAQWDEAIPIEEYTNDEGKIIQKPKYKFQNLRAQMYWEFREDLRLGLVDIDIEDKTVLDGLFMELTIIRVRYKDNFIVVEPKEEIKKRLGGKSPNKADGAVYWNWIRKGYRVTSGFLPVVG